MHSVVKYCFPFFLISRLLRGTHRTDLSVEVTNLMKGNTVWAHFMLTGYHSTSIRLSGQIPKKNCFQMMHIDWDNTVVTGISGIKIEMPTETKVSIFTDNDLTHNNDDHFKIDLVASVPVPPPRYNYCDDPHANVSDQPILSTSTGATALAPLFSFTA